eukprot:CAMPEP_0113718516 /NCGR_PEP_ID=MMETSP0038_2-20120614/35244_1 /TAXON_ID=2898 /ORGANISM="Cryptomonas paramecium" /LENGTH=299 /DNA_ID=CAMNT_0000646669 /DNA_START=238 /DNA_END=1133 /DNA_ORIENTATION=+ /assembly_acc=CAM_ASM_000170
MTPDLTVSVAALDSALATSLFQNQPSILSNGSLSFMLAADHSGIATFQIDITNGTCSDTPTRSQNLTIAVASVNNPPTFSLSTNAIAVSEGSGNWSYAVITSISPGAGEEGTQNVSLLVGTTGDNIFALAPTAIATSATTASLRFTLLPSGFGHAQVSIVAQDNGGVLRGGRSRSDPQYVSITVLPSNTPPSFTLSTSLVSADHDTGLVVIPFFIKSFSAGPPRDVCIDVPPPCTPQTVVFFIADVARADLFLIQPHISADGTLRFSTRPGATGTANVSVYAEDTGLAWSAAGYQANRS